MFKKKKIYIFIIFIIIIIIKLYYKKLKFRPKNFQINTKRLIKKRLKDH